MKRALLGLLSPLLLASTGLGAQTKMAASLGFQGWYRPNACAPLRVEILNAGDVERFMLEVRVPNSFRGTEVTATPVSVPKGTRKILSFTVYVPGHGSMGLDDMGRCTVPVRLIRENGRLEAEALAAAKPVNTSLLVLAVGPAFGGPARRIENRDLIWVRIPWAELPERPEALEGVDAVVLAEPLAHLKRSPRAAACLRQWVRGSGRIVAWGFPSLYGSPPAPWLGFAPALGTAPAPVGFSESPLFGNFEGSSNPPVVRRFSEDGGIVLARDEIGPLIVETAEGTGSAVFLAFDPASKNVRWEDDRKRLWEFLLGRGTAAESQDEYGYDGDSTHWARAFANVVCNQVSIKPVGYSTFLLVFLGFAVLVGPGIATVLGKRRGPWVWVAVPLLSGLFAAGTYWFALRDRPGGSDLYQMTFADCTADGIAGPCTAVLGLFAADGGWHEIELESARGVAGGLEAEDQGAGGVFGAMRGMALERFVDGPAFRAYMNPYSARAFKAAFDLPPDAEQKLGSGFELTPCSAGGVLLKNRTKLAFKGGWLLTGSEAGVLPPLSPGASVEVSMDDSLGHYTSNRLHMVAWASGLIPMEMQGLVAATAYSRLWPEWCPFDRNRSLRDDRYLLLALTEDPFAPAALKEAGRRANEITVVRCVLRCSP